jgi:DNA-binding NtrC family response regulator
MRNQRHAESDHEEGASLISPQTASRQVLIVEDDARLREMLRTSIQEMGLFPTPAASAELAIKLAKSGSFAIALLDLNLPGMDGMELCEHLHRTHPRMQAIILTGFGDFEAARRSIRLGVVDFLTKPCGMDELEAALNRARLRWLERWEEADPVPPPPPPVIIEPPPTPAEKSHLSMEQIEREMILAALARHNGNRQASAEELGISVRKLYYRLKQYQRAGFISGI